LSGYVSTCMLGVSIERLRIYMYVRGIDFASICNFSVGF
jgi:hypothetical protein